MKIFRIVLHILAIIVVLWGIYMQHKHIKQLHQLLDQIGRNP